MFNFFGIIYHFALVVYNVQITWIQRFNTYLAFLFNVPLGTMYANIAQVNIIYFNMYSLKLRIHFKIIKQLIYKYFTNLYISSLYSFVHLWMQLQNLFQYTLAVITINCRLYKTAQRNQHPFGCPNRTINYYQLQCVCASKGIITTILYYVNNQIPILGIRNPYIITAFNECCMSKIYVVYCLNLGLSFLIEEKYIRVFQ